MQHINCQISLLFFVAAPQHFQDDTTSQILFSENGDPEQVQIHFTVSNASLGVSCVTIL